MKKLSEAVGTLGKNVGLPIAFCVLSFVLWILKALIAVGILVYKKAEKSS